ncbi:hypothetical protein OXPF_18480 [Oxobacter pfennigii]|uniref:Uncharacterized protein n=1 Tax=Oxobacter pfennigii TaxID=36849 RepID=A0A0P8WQD8_9CLOT|nr:hypothetical protein OXPF_18480 [Oxobacter pfennigii]
MKTVEAPYVPGAINLRSELSLARLVHVERNKCSVKFDRALLCLRLFHSTVCISYRCRRGKDRFYQQSFLLLWVFSLCCHHG